MGWDEPALRASGKTSFDNAIRPVTGRSQRALPDRIHVAFDDHRPAASAGPVPPVFHGDRRGTVSPQSPLTTHSSCRRRLTTISTLSMQASSVSPTGAPRLAPDRQCGRSSNQASTGNSSPRPSLPPHVTSSAWP